MDSSVGMSMSGCFRRSSRRISMYSFRVLQRQHELTRLTEDELLLLCKLRQVSIPTISLLSTHIVHEERRRLCEIYINVFISNPETVYNKKFDVWASVAPVVIDSWFSCNTHRRVSISGIKLSNSSNFHTLYVFLTESGKTRWIPESDLVLTIGLP